MVSEWEKQRLEDCMDVIIDYRGKTPKKTDCGIPLITAKIIKKGRLLPVFEYIAEEDYDAWMRRGIPLPGDVVLTTEAPLGEVAQLDGRKIALAQRVITLRGKQDVLDNTYLKYLLMSHDVQHQLDGRGSGTTVKGIKQSELREVMLTIPELSEQKAIAHMLGSLDDRIELNWQMNETLESMAQALFKSWFVDFDPVIDNALAVGNPIPGELSERAEVRRKVLADGTANREAAKQFPAAFQLTESMGWIPEGWCCGSILEKAKLLSGGTPKTSISEYWDGDIPWASAKDVSQCGESFLINSARHITHTGLAKSSTKIIPKFSTVFVARGATTGRLTMFGDDMAMNQTCYGLWADWEMYFYTYCHSKHFIDSIVNAGHGSIFTTITTTTFEASKVIHADEMIICNFEELVSPIFQKILSNQVKTRTLTKLRDILLPKLLSGEIRIPDAEKMVEELAL